VLRQFSDAVVTSSPNKLISINQAEERLIAKVEFAYGVAAKLADREPTLEGNEAIWAKMVAICDQIAGTIRPAGEPDLVSKVVCDRLLDYRNAAESRRQLHS